MKIFAWYLCGNNKKAHYPKIIRLIFFEGKAYRTSIVTIDGFSPMAMLTINEITATAPYMNGSGSLFSVSSLVYMASISLK